MSQWVGRRRGVTGPGGLIGAVHTVSHIYSARKKKRRPKLIYRIY